MADFSAATVPDWGGSPADLIEDLGTVLAARYGEAEQQMIAEVSRRLAERLDDDGTALVADRARVLGELRRMGQGIAADLADPEFADAVINIASVEGRAAALRRMGIGVPTGGAALTGTSANAAGQIALDLFSSLDQMSLRITRWMPDVYQRLVSQLAPQVVLGTRTITQVQRATAEQFLARGVTGFTDTAGRDWKIGTYAEMATRTTVNRAWQAANIDAQQEQGINLVTIVIGLDACKVCAAHAGRVWSTDGTPAGTYRLEHAAEDRFVDVEVAGTLDQARAGGWNHPNCRCVVVAYLPGLRITGSAHDPERERARDELRRLERRVRDLKRREAAAFDDVSKARYRARIRNAQRDIRDHVTDTGIMRKPYREQLAYSDGQR